MGTFFKFSVILLVSLLGFAGIYLLKITLNKVIPAGSDMLFTLRTMSQVLLHSSMWLALVCYGLVIVMYLFLLQSDQVSKIFSITVGINVVITALGAKIFLDETVDATRAAGIALVVIGIFLINGVE